MPTSTRSLTLDQATQRIRERAFPQRTGERVGLEFMPEAMRWNDSASTTSRF
jgi:hypothetical protein